MSARNLSSLSSVGGNESTETRLLQTAEKLFTQFGFEGVSLRQITEAAGVNLAAVNYHFGSKDGLIRSVIDRVLRPINEKRIAWLQNAESSAEGEPLAFKTIIECWTGPIVEDVGFRLKEEGFDITHLIARIISDQSERMQDQVILHFPKVSEVYCAAILRSNPGLNPDSALLRLLQMEGAMIYCLLYSRRLDKIAPTSFSTRTMLEIMECVSDFLTAGFEAPDRCNSLVS